MSTNPNPRSTTTVDPTAEIEFVTEALRAERDAIERIAANAGTSAADWAASIALVAECDGHVVVAGMGKSGLVGAKISATLSSLGRPSHILHPAEAVHGDLGRIRRGDIALLLSFSGETEEVVALASILRADDVPCIGISRDAGSSLGRACAAHLTLGDVTEACPLQLAPTASTTAMLAVGDALALAASRRRDFDADAFHRHHPGGMLGAGLRPILEVLRFRVGDNVVVVAESHTVQEELGAAAADRRAGAILLVDGQGSLTGIFTDGDLRRLVRTEGADGLQRPIVEVMTVNPRRLDAQSLVRDAVRLVRERRVDEIPVVDEGGAPVGIVDVQDLIAMKAVQE